MPFIRKICMVTHRATSHVLFVPRYEVPVRRALNPPDIKVSVQTMDVGSLPRSEIIEVSSAEEAFEDLRSRVAALGGDARSVYPTLDDFRREFDATLRRDRVEINKKTGETRLVREDTEDKTLDWEPLREITGVNDELAKALAASGLSSIHAVAGAELDSLESIPGIGPSTAESIRSSARSIAGGGSKAGGEDTGGPFQPQTPPKG